MEWGDYTCDATCDVRRATCDVRTCGTCGTCGRAKRAETRVLVDRNDEVVAHYEGGTEVMQPTSLGLTVGPAIAIGLAISLQAGQQQTAEALRLSDAPAGAIWIDSLNLSQATIRRGCSSGHCS